MNSTFFIGMFNFSYRAILLNINGISNEESLKSPQPAGNCMNWILGHIIVSRASMLNSIAQEQIQIHAQTEVYGRGSSVNPENRSLISFENLKKDLSNVHNKFISWVNALSTEEFTAMIRKDKSLADDLVFLYFHEAYHAGQIGQLRRLLGRKGSIR